jgi:hypothetical protein
MKVRAAADKNFLLSIRFRQHAPFPAQILVRLFLKGTLQMGELMACIKIPLWHSISSRSTLWSPLIQAKVVHERCPVC